MKTKEILSGLSCGIMLFCMTLCLVLLTGCDQKTSLRAQIQRELDAQKKNYPMKVAGGNFLLEGMTVDGDYLCMDYSIAKEAVDDFMVLSEEEMNSEENVARVLNNLDKRALNSIIKAELGLKLTYKVMETGKQIAEIKIDAARIKTISEKVNNGKIKAMSTLDSFREDIKNVELPVAVDEITTMTKVEIKNNNVYYTLEIDIEDFQFEAENLKEMKKEIIKSLKETPLYLHKKNMIKENIHVVYEYYNLNGELAGAIDIDPIEL